MGTTQPGIELRGHLGLCHLRIVIFEKYVTLEICKNILYTVIFSTRYFMHNYAFEYNKIFNFYKNGRISTKLLKIFQNF